MGYIFQLNQRLRRINKDYKDRVQGAINQVLIPDVGGIIKLNGPKFKIKELFSDYKARV